MKIQGLNLGPPIPSLVTAILFIRGLIMDIDLITLPKASGLDKIKKDFDEFLTYWLKVESLNA